MVRERTSGCTGTLPLCGEGRCVAPSTGRQQGTTRHLATKEKATRAPCRIALRNTTLEKLTVKRPKEKITGQGAARCCLGSTMRLLIQRNAMFQCSTTTQIFEYAEKIKSISPSSLVFRENTGGQLNVQTNVVQNKDVSVCSSSDQTWNAEFVVLDYTASRNTLALYNSSSCPSLRNHSCLLDPTHGGSNDAVHRTRPTANIQVIPLPQQNPSRAMLQWDLGKCSKTLVNLMNTVYSRYFLRTLLLLLLLALPWGRAVGDGNPLSNHRSGGGVGSASPCPVSEHSCDNLQCVPRDKVCNGWDDCGDNSDEHPGCTREYTR